MRSLAFALALSVSAARAAGPDPTADEIMSRVAENQDRAEAARTRYVYVQHARVSSRKGKIPRCEEITDSRVTPLPNGLEQKLLKLEGKVLKSRKYVTYSLVLPQGSHDEPQDGAGGHSLTVEADDTDRELVHELRLGLTNDKSKDGLPTRLFPFTSESQSGYSFELVGRERVKDRDAFHIVFRPKEKTGFGWKGDAYIDSVEYQPICRWDWSSAQPQAA